MVYHIPILFALLWTEAAFGDPIAGNDLWLSWRSNFANFIKVDSYAVRIKQPT